MIQQFNKSERSDEAKYLMKYLLNEPVMNDTGWPDYNKKVKQETNLRSDSRPYLNDPTLMALPMMALPIMALSTMTRVRPSVLAHRAY